jgi:hypothetical protein
MSNGTYTEHLNYATNFNVPLLIHIVVCSTALTTKIIMETIRPNELEEGQTALIKRWVNQPQYVGDKLRLEDGKLIRTTKNGIDTVGVDMRYPHFCKVGLL